MSKYVAPNSRSTHERRHEESFDRRSQYKYDVVCQSIRSRISKDGGSGIIFGIERLRGFHTRDEAIEYAHKCQSRLRPDETIYVNVTEDGEKSCIYYVTSKIAAASSDRVPDSRGK